MRKAGRRFPLRLAFLPGQEQVGTLVARGATNSGRWFCEVDATVEGKRQRRVAFFTVEQIQEWTGVTLTAEDAKKVRCVR